jgi:hypothetical protein
MEKGDERKLLLRFVTSSFSTTIASTVLFLIGTDTADPIGISTDEKYDSRSLKTPFVIGITLTIFTFIYGAMVYA